MDIRNGKAENDKKKNGRGRALTASPDELSCMKCDSRFPSGHAALKLRTVQLASNGNGHAAMTPKGQLEEYSTCPHCGSDMIFAVQPTVCHRLAYQLHQLLILYINFSGSSG